MTDAVNGLEDCEVGRDNARPLEHVVALGAAPHTTHHRLTVVTRSRRRAHATAAAVAPCAASLIAADVIHTARWWRGLGAAAAAGRGRVSGLGRDRVRWIVACGIGLRGPCGGGGGRGLREGEGGGGDRWSRLHGWERGEDRECRSARRDLTVAEAVLDILHEAAATRPAQQMFELPPAS